MIIEDETEIKELSLKELKEEVHREVEQSTEEVFLLHAQILEYGKTSIELVIRAGQLLHSIKQSLKHGKWTEWCRVNTGEKFSVQTMRRYMRLSEVVKESPMIFIDCESLTEAYQKCGILLRPKDETESTPTNGEPQTRKPSTNEIVKVRKLVQQLTKTLESVDGGFRESLIAMLEPLAKYFNERVSP